MSRTPHLTIVSLVAGLALFAAACGGSGSSDSEAASADEVAALETETPTAEAAAAEMTEDEIAELWDQAVLDFSACVREDVEGFPDLNARAIEDFDSFIGELQGAGVNLDDPIVGETMFYCQDVLGEVAQFQEPPTAEENQAVEEAALAIMECIRENGYPEVPDLDLSEGLDANVLLQLVPYVDLADPEFQNVAGGCVAEAPVDFDGRDTIASLLQS